MLALVVVVLAIAAFEYFGKVTEKGYRPAVAPGLAACVAAPLAAYWVGERGAAARRRVRLHRRRRRVHRRRRRRVRAAAEHGRHDDGRRVDRPARLVRRARSCAGRTSGPASSNIGTDTLFLIVLGVVANDIGALLVGSSVGKTPLRAWISPSKTVEGLIGGTLMTLLVLFVVGAHRPQRHVDRPATC